jgi:hypothetical protein
MRKKVDPRIRTLVENGVKARQRSMFVIVGDKGRDQVREWGVGSQGRRARRGARRESALVVPPPPPRRRRRRRRPPPTLIFSPSAPF